MVVGYFIGDTVLYCIRKKRKTRRIEEDYETRRREMEGYIRWYSPTKHSYIMYGTALDAYFA